MKITIQSGSTYYEATIQQNTSVSVSTETEVPDDFASALSGAVNGLGADASPAAAAGPTESFRPVAAASSVVTNVIPASILGGTNPTAYAAGTILNIAKNGVSYVSTPVEGAGQQAAGNSASDAGSTQKSAGSTAASSTNASRAAANTASSSGASGSVNLDAIFTEAAETYGVDKKLLLAVARHESNFRTDVTSSSGAMGVMQLMPQTAAGIGVTDGYDPYQNIMGGARLLSDHLKQYNGNLDLALAAYNAGVGTVRRYGGVPPFTEKYIAKIKESMADPTLAAPGA